MSPSKLEVSYLLKYFSKQKNTHSFLYFGNSQKFYFGGGLPLFQILVTFTPQHMLFCIDVRDAKVNFKKRILSKSSLFMGILLNMLEFLVYGESIKVRQNLHYVPNKNVFGFGRFKLETPVINPLTPGYFPACYFPHNHGRLKLLIYEG